MSEADPARGTVDVQGVSLHDAAHPHPLAALFPDTQMTHARSALTQALVGRSDQPVRRWSAHMLARAAERFKTVPPHLLPPLLAYLRTLDETPARYAVEEPDGGAFDRVLARVERGSAGDRGADAAAAGLPPRAQPIPIAGRAHGRPALPPATPSGADVTDLVLRCSRLAVSADASPPGPLFASPPRQRSSISLPYYDNEDEWRNNVYIYGDGAPESPVAPPGIMPSSCPSRVAERPVGQQALVARPAGSRACEQFDFEGRVVAADAGDVKAKRAASQRRFDELVPELLDCIFGYLPKQALLSVALTNKYMFVHAARHLYRTPQLSSRSTFSRFLQRLEAPQADPYLAYVRVIDLSVFRLHGAIVTDAAATLLARGCGERLQELNLTGCQRLSEAVGLQAFLDHCPNVRVAVLNGCAALTDRGLRRLARRFVRLEVLQLLGCRLITDRGLCALRRYCPRLRELAVSFAPGITGAGLVRMAQGRRRTSRARPLLPGTPPVASSALVRRGSDPGVRRAPASMLSRQLAQAAPLSDSSGTSSGSDASASSGRAAERLPLRSLVVKACGLFSEEHLVALAAATPQLRTLELEYNVGSHRLTRDALVRALPHWPNLESLHVVQPLVSYSAGVGRPQTLSEHDVNLLLRTFAQLQRISQVPSR